MTQARGEVFDIGYQRYAGVREGRVRALKTLWSNGVRTSLGIGRGLFAKIIPGLTFLILMIPALGFPVLNAMLGEAAEFVDLIPGQDEYYTWFAFVFILFAAIVGPELLIGDKRSGVINLYLVRPLTTTDYVLGRWLAFFSVAFAMLLIPQLTLFVGLVLGAENQVDYIRENWANLPRSAAAGAALAVFAATLTLGVSAFVGRRAIASVFVIGLVLITSAVSSIAMEEMTSENEKWLALLSISDYPVYVNDIIFGREFTGAVSGGAATVKDLPDYVVWAAFSLSVALPAALLWGRYRRFAL